MDAEDILRAILERHSSDDLDLWELLCGRHDGAAVALRYRDTQDVQTDTTFAELSHQSLELAGALAGIGVSRGDRVIRQPERGRFGDGAG